MVIQTIQPKDFIAAMLVCRLHVHAGAWHLQDNFLYRVA
jgi:hypothetical protein